MQDWLHAKLKHITAEFQQGHGIPVVYEAQFLAYLDCLITATRGPEAASAMWEAFKAECLKVTPPANFAQRVTDREELVAALQTFKRKFEGPSRKPFRRPAQSTAPVRSSDAPECDLFDLLSGDAP